MAADRGRVALLAALIVVLAVMIYRAWPGTAERPPAPSNRTRAQGPAAKPAAGGVTAPDVKIEELEADRPAPKDSQRNLFRFKPQAPPPPPPPPQASGMRGPERSGPPPAPSVPPIPLRFIGFVKDEQGTLAALVDDRGVVFHGREGSNIDGRYVITRIGVESIEMSYLDGRGRQTIPLSNR